MKKMPDVLFIVDTHQEVLAVREANRMGIPVVGIVDTNADPDNINYVIPSNDDAVGALKLLISHILEAWIEGKTSAKQNPATSSESNSTKSSAAVAKETEETKVEKKPAKPVEKKVKKAEDTVIARPPASGGSEAKQSFKNEEPKAKKTKKTKENK